MAIKEIRLTESELTKLIKIMVKEVKDDMETKFNDEDESSDDKMTKKEAIEKIADFLDSELTKRQKEKLEDKINKMDESIRMRYERPLREGDKNLSSRRGNFKDNLKIAGGIGMTSTGAVAALGNIMGYAGQELTAMIHDITQQAGLEQYTGPVTYAMVAAGIALFLKGMSDKYDRKQKG
jgi:hypothetical protein